MPGLRKTNRLVNTRYSIVGVVADTPLHFLFFFPGVPGKRVPWFEVATSQQGKGPKPS